MKSLKARLKKEALCFDKIAEERRRHKHIPDIRSDFLNEYFYNNIWRKSLFVREEFGTRAKWIIDSLKKAGVSSTIELGCGTGWLSLELARAGFEVTGLDISKESVFIAQNYLKSLTDKKELLLRYICKNIFDYKEYKGQSVVCFGFLHHLTPKLLEQLLSYLSKNMQKGQVLIAHEPRYDHAHYEIAALIYGLRLVFPNHFKYTSVNTHALSHIKEIFDDLSNTRKDQSEMDNESPSDLIVELIRKKFKKVKIKYCTSFFDKFIGSVRLTNEKDTEILSNLLKQLDRMIVKYNYNCSRVVMIKAVKG